MKPVSPFMGGGRNFLYFTTVIPSEVQFEHVQLSSVLTCPTYTSSLALRGLSSKLSQNSELSSDETENWKSPGGERKCCTHDQTRTLFQENRHTLLSADL